MLVKDPSRKLARLELVTNISPIKKADRLEVISIGGWDCVVQKGLYKVGDTVLYIEIGSAIEITNQIIRDFDMTYATKRKDISTDKDFISINTVKLRGVVSQGLILNRDVLRNVGLNPDHYDHGVDIADALNIYKYVSPKEEHLYRTTATQSGNESNRWYWKLRNWLLAGITHNGLIPFPRGQKKSDEERVQNCKQLYDELVQNKETVEVTAKLDGESATFYIDLDTGLPGVAQRNWGLRTTDVEYTFMQSLRVYLADWVRYISCALYHTKLEHKPIWKKAYYAYSIPLVNYYLTNNIGQKLTLLNANLVPSKYNHAISVQGEMVGPDFNGNAENVSANKFYMYRAYLHGAKPLPPAECREIANALGVEYVPVLYENIILPEDIRTLIKMADGPNVLDGAGLREGIVVKDSTGQFSFKAISNKWLGKDTENQL